MRRDEVTPVNARLVEVAVPITVSPFVNVDDAASRPLEKVKSVEVAFDGNE